MEPDINSLWAQAPKPTQSTIPDDPKTDPSIPDGEYDAEILDFRCFLDKSGRWWMKWIMAVSGGLMDGRMLVRFVEVKGSTISFLKSDIFHSLGRDAEFMGELADIPSGRSGPVASELRGAVVLARKRSRRADDGRTFLDVYINGTVSLPGNPPPRPASETAPPWPDDSNAPADEEDDGIPF